MPHNRYFTKNFFENGKEVLLEDSEFQHLTRVMRQKEGSSVELINGQGQLALGSVNAIQKKAAVIGINSVTDDTKPTFCLVLALAFLKPNHLEFAIEKAVELGVTDIWLFPGTLSEKKEISEQYLVRLNSIILSSCKQCGRLFFPNLEIKKRLQDCKIESKSVAFFGDVEKEAPPLRSYASLITQDATIIFFIGCESGFTDKEIDFLKAQKAHGVRLHQNILRAETAAIACINLVSEMVSL